MSNEDVVECNLDDAIEKLERVCDEVLREGWASVWADAFYALTYLKHERGDDATPSS